VIVPGGWWPILRQGDLVAYLQEDEMRRLVAAMEPATAEAGAIVLHRGSPSKSVLYVEEGELEILDEVLGQPVVLDRIGKGGVVGEIGFLDGRARTHDVRAPVATRLHRLSRETLLGMSGTDPALFAKVMISLAELAANRFRVAMEHLKPVRALAASLGEPVDLEDAPGAGAPEFDMLDEPIPGEAIDFLRDLARRGPGGVAGV
jgi:CRP-like cAMP-binding protein